MTAKRRRDHAREEAGRTPSVRVTLRLCPDVAKTLASEAKRIGIPMSSIVELAVLSWASVGYVRGKMPGGS